MKVIANELRIGNIVMLVGRGEFVHVSEVVSIMNHGVEVDIIDNGEEWLSTTQNCEYESIQPIPITEERLKMAGFGMCEDHTMSLVVYPSLVIEYDYHFQRCNLVLDTEHDTVIIPLPHVQFLHHIQNLYHSLKGEELTFNNHDQ